MNHMECSYGPVHTMPGSCVRISFQDCPCDECSSMATHRIQGETDSFGCEYFYLCDTCYEKYKLELSQQDLSGVCDWCKKMKPHLYNHRDYEEGSYGRVYNVCMDCIEDERQRWKEYNDEDYEGY